MHCHVCLLPSLNLLGDSTPLTIIKFTNRSVQKHGNIHYFKADVTSKPDLAAAANHIAEKTGYVNVVVANSGIIGPTMRYLKEDATLKETQDYLWNWDSDEFNQSYNVNVNGAFFTAIAFLELLDKGNKAGNVEQDSQFICVSSAGAFSRVLMSGFAYAGSKAAVIHITKQLATKLVPFGIRCNVLAPGCKLHISHFISPGRFWSCQCHES